MKVVFFGSAGNVFSERFCAALTKAPCSIVAVVDVPASKRSSTNPTHDRRALSFTEDAARHGIPIHQPTDPNAPEFVAAMRALQPDLFLAAGYMFRLRTEILSVPRILAANAHASLLPSYRGRSPVFWALRHGERYSGLTIHSMDDRLDTGDLLYQVRVRVNRNDTVASLYDRIIARSLKLVPRLIADAEHGRLPRKPQPSDGGSYFSSAKEEDFRIDWNRNVEELRRWITITPGKCFTEITGKRVFLLDAKLAPNPRKAAPGTFIRRISNVCTVATQGGALRVRMNVLPT